MKFMNWICGVLGRPAVQAAAIVPPPRLLLTQACLDAIRSGLEPEICKGHEGIVFLLGRTDGITGLAVTVFRPSATTSRGSFHVDAGAMASCVRAAGQHELQIVGQLHTHPGAAYHSDGDIEGARIRYPGFVSVVIPEHGSHLPELNGAAAYIWTGSAWRELGPHDIIIIPGGGPWTGRNGIINVTTAHSATPGAV
jgi:proteasome lid subunit RPN8/RPN11